MTDSPVRVSPALELRKIARRYGQNFVLRDVSLDLERGETLALYGPNGAGKTTLLKILAGALSCTKGEGRIYGYDLKDKASVRQHTHMLGHAQSLYADLTVLENLSFSARMHKVSLEAIPGALERVGLEKATHKRIRELSAGMRKRAQFARVLLIESPLLLIDEPYANLDKEGRALAQEFLLELRTQGRTVLLSSHEPELADLVATRRGTLEGGVFYGE